jgi:hypothetical protein
MGKIEESVVNGSIGLALSMVGTYGIAMRRGAENLDREHEDKIKLQGDELAIEKARVRNLNAEVEDLKKPKRTAFEEKEYQIIKSTVDGYDELHKDVLRHLLRVGKMTETFMVQLSPLPPKLNRDATTKILNQFAADNIAFIERGQGLRGFEDVWQIAPGAIRALNELL